MQIRSFRGSGEPAWVIAFTNARERLGPDPRRALGPAATPAASTGRTRDRTRPMLQKRQKVLARAPSTRDSSQRTLAEPGKAGPHGDETTCFAAHAGRAEGVDRRASIHSFGQGRSDQAGGSADSRRNEIIMNTARSPARAALEDEAADAIGRRLARPFGGARLEAGGHARDRDRRAHLRSGPLQSSSTSSIGTKRVDHPSEHPRFALLLPIGAQPCSPIRPSVSCISPDSTLWPSVWRKSKHPLRPPH